MRLKVTWAEFWTYCKSMLNIIHDWAIFVLMLNPYPKKTVAMDLFLKLLKLRKIF